MNENSTKQTAKIGVDKNAIPNNCIWYESANGEIVEPHICSAFDANIVSNIYENGKGIIAFDNDITKIDSSAFEGCVGLTSIAIPDSVTEIGDCAFSGCTGLTSIAISDSITEIGEWAFAECTGLTSIAISDSITEIGGSAFEGCTSLTSITIPDSVTAIGEEAFCGCAGLTSIAISDSVTEIGEEAFSRCTSLTSIYCKPPTQPTLGKDVFDNIAPNAKIYVPRASVNAYKTAEGWGNYASKIVGYDFE